MARKKTENGDTVTTPVPVDDPAHDIDEPNRPAHVVKFGYVKATIWRNETEQGTRYNVTCSRVYKGSDNEWFTSGTFGLRDLLNLAKCLDHAHTWINAQYDETPF